ncbi:anthranilate synthase component II [Anaerostipes sp.]|uniref:anthranilate synthase component II n=1 Tax=Anaerostipes sp. TaxID=1872530 RepID=UPI0025C5FAE1|nr:aminodeoxychorismate/anthranilate synthase component II [Anaerostipes sp.]MBS7009223.1 aminodeoxychorismate/anthranilate synthase component II [Anaerostipes sp.]
MYVIIDHYDSYVYNLARELEVLGGKTELIRSDKADPGYLEYLRKQGSLEGLILSPGPKRPEDCEDSVQLVLRFAGRIPILGVCLGHQMICRAFGGWIVKGARPMHGKVTKVIHTRQGLFQGLPKEFLVTRYHSLIAERESLPDVLRLDAVSFEREVMAVSHKTQPVFGVQFHPEAVLTEYGSELLQNYMNICERWRKHGDKNQKSTIL